MLYYNLFFFLCVIFITILLNYGSTLNEEKILNGHLAIQEEFSYQVAIFAKPISSEREDLICGGGIIDPFFILSAAHCFFYNFTYLTTLSYIVLAGVNHMNSASAIRAEIEFIYVLDFDERLFYTKDIAVLKLRTALNLEDDVRLSKLNLPNSNEDFQRRSAKVSGYGCNWILIDEDPETSLLNLVNSSSDDLLRYLFVNILVNEECQETFPLIDLSTQLCATVPPRLGGEPAGVCMGDSGSPLVNGGKFIGIVTATPIDCDDTFYGGVYTKVMPYLEFINAVLAETPSPDTTVHTNSPYV